jgi:regulator of sigma D
MLRIVVFLLHIIAFCQNVVSYIAVSHFAISYASYYTNVPWVRVR